MASAFSALAPAAAPKVPGMSYVNLSARQRMLSQRMLLQTVLAVQGDRRQFDAARASLALFSESQVLLEDVARHREQDAQRAAVLRDTYRGPRGVGPVIDAFRQAMARTLAEIDRDGAAADGLAALVGQNDDVLAALNAATAAFDRLAGTRSAAVRQELAGIVSAIQRVAREAKVVSFNARVMAARAGQHGREFTVVAQVLIGITEQVDELSLQAMALVDGMD